jgi:hypothetical protein
MIGKYRVVQTLGFLAGVDSDNGDKKKGKNREGEGVFTLERYILRDSSTGEGVIEFGPARSSRSSFLSIWFPHGIESNVKLIPYSIPESD